MSTAYRLPVISDEYGIPFTGHGRDEHAHERISDSRLEWLTGGTHPGFLFSPGAQAKALAGLTSIQV